MTAPQPPPSPAPGHAGSSWVHVELQVPERAWVRCCAHTHAPTWAHVCRAELICAREGVCRQERDAAARRHGAHAAPSQHMQGQEPGSAGNSPTRRRQRKPRASRAGTGKSSCGGDGGTQLGWGRRVGIAARGSPRHVPGGEDGVLVHARADVLGDVGVGVAGGAQQRVVGLADGQEEGRVVAGGQLDNVCHQGRGTEPEHMDAWGWQEQDGGSPSVPHRAPSAHPALEHPQALGWVQCDLWGLRGAVHCCYHIQGAPVSPPAPGPSDQLPWWAGLPPRLRHNVPTNLTVRRRKELKLQPPALMLPSAPARPFSLDCRQYTMPSPTMIWGGNGGSGGATP